MYLPGFGLHPLRGDLAGSWAVRVSGISRKQLADIVNCRSGISPEMAIRLDKAFGRRCRDLVPASIGLRIGPGDEEGGPDQGGTAYTGPQGIAA